MNEGRITKLTCYKTGMGYYTREYSVQDNDTIILPYSIHLNDILKSIHIKDLDGGEIREIGFKEYSEYPDRKFKDMYSKFDILSRLENEKIRIKAGGKKYEGILIAVERIPRESKADDAGNNETKKPQTAGILTEAEIDELLAAINPLKRKIVLGITLLLLNGAIKTFFMEQIDELEIIDREIKKRFLKHIKSKSTGLSQQDIQMILGETPNEQELTAMEDPDLKSLIIKCEGNGKRRIEISYAIPVPVWRVSYSLDLTQNNHQKGIIRAFALIDNNLNQDLTEVKLTLMGGKPISFEYDLTTPRLTTRYKLTENSPVLPIELKSTGEAEGDPLDNSNKRNRELNTGIMNNGALISLSQLTILDDGSIQRILRDIDTTDLVTALKNEDAEVQDKIYRNMSNRAACLLKEDLEYMGPIRLEEVDKSRQKILSTVENLMDKGEISDPRIPLSEAIKLAKEKVPDALFEYIIPDKISLKSYKSTFIPLFAIEIAIEPILFYNDFCRWHPYAAVLFTNSTTTPFETGPINVCCADTYCGDSMMPICLPGDKKVLSYAVELGVTIDRSTHRKSKDVHEIFFAAGDFRTLHYQEQIIVYHLQNTTAKKFVIYLEHPIKKNTVLTKPEKYTGRERGNYLFQIELDQHQTMDFEVIEREDIYEIIDVDFLRKEDLTFYDQEKLLSPESKQLMGEIVDLNRKIRDFQTDINTYRNNIEQIGADHNRIRENIKVLSDSDSEKVLKEKYIQKMIQNEDQINDLTQKIASLESQIQELEEAKNNLLKQNCK
jgi:hypothetical protein